MNPFENRPFPIALGDPGAVTSGIITIAGRLRAFLL
jgi:hypothetical protein